MRIVIIGAKASGKSTFGKELHSLLGIPYMEIDDLIEQLYLEAEGEKKTCKEIYDEAGDDEFRRLEESAVESLKNANWSIIITGGSTFLSHKNRKVLRDNSIIIFCKCETDILLDRVKDQNSETKGISKSVFLKWYKDDIEIKNELYSHFADIVIDTGSKSPRESAEEARSLISEEMAVLCSSPNTLGELIRVTTFGESHGHAIGAVLDGLPSGIPISEEDIQKELDKRKPGQSSVTTPRKEEDRINILSGVFNGVTTGSPIALLIYNKDSDSSKYEEIKHLFRPGHADFTFYQKYSTRDYRGGGRSSGRETAARVAAGAFARKVLNERGVSLYAHAIEIGGVKAEKIDYSTIENNIVRCADEDAVTRMVDAINKARASHDSIGGIVQLDIHGIPPGLGDPVFAKLDARLTHAIMSLGAVKGIEIGSGFETARMTGRTANDEITSKGFLSNNAGGILGGISTGQAIVMRIAVKPTPSISQEQRTIDKNGNSASVIVEGRHDPCIVPRIIPVIESMAALVVLDAWDVQSRVHPDWLSAKTQV